MPALLADRKIVGALIVLAIGQIIGWGTLGLPPIVGRQMAADLNMTIAAVFAGTSVFYVTMGLCTPFLARLLVRHGARPIMAIGSVLLAPGFIVLSLAQGPGLYYLAWAMLGMAGSATLSTSSYVMLSEVAGSNAKRAIGALLLATGLSYSVFWPVTAFISSFYGWRGAALAYAVLTVMGSCPLYYFGLPRPALGEKPAAPRSKPVASTKSAPSPPGTFIMVMAVIALNAFVTLGLGAVFIELLKACGFPEADAIVYGSFLGVIQISARIVDFIGGARWDGISTALFAGSVLPLSMLILLVGEGAHWSIVSFILLYGLSSGAMAVARATIPLSFYDSSAFARATARIALPLNLMSAAAPPVLASLLVHSGYVTMIDFVLVCCGIVLWLLVMLRRRRPGFPDQVDLNKAA
jgi:predicted MFS family arabinose efflux permease